MESGLHLAWALTILIGTTDPPPPPTESHQLPINVPALSDTGLEFLQ